MSILHNTRKRLFSFSKGSGRPDPLNEETESVRGVSGLGLEDSVRRLSMQQSEMSVSGGVEEKRKPSSYVFLQIDNPEHKWREIDDHSGADAHNLDDKNFDRYELEKVCRDERTGETASCRIVYKFSDDAFDDYLYEIGLLTTRFPRFEDLMAEVEMIKDLEHSNVIKFFDVHYFDTRLWVLSSSFYLLPRVI